LHNGGANLNPDGACMQQPAPDRAALREKLIKARLALTDRLERAVQLQSVLRVWLVGRRENTIGAYWPIKGEFDPLPALYRWAEGAPEDTSRRIGLPVANRATGQLRFHVWYPGCPMEHDAYDIPKPKDTEEFAPEILVVPCLGFGPGGVRLGYGGGFFDRTLASLTPRPVTVGVSFTHGFLPLLRSSAADLPLDAMLTEDGVMWQRPD
jgi:5-formyltetrahydrofolate cyclo-ligase